MKNLLVLAVVILLTNCQNNAPTSHDQLLRKDKAEVFEVADEAQAEEAIEVNLGMQVSDEIAYKSTPERLQPKLIKTGNLSLLVGDIKESRKKVGQIVDNLNGYIARENLNDYETGLNISATVRVPAHHFDTLLVLLEGIAKKTENKTVNTEDVTEEFVDTEARLKTKKELEARYKEILKQARTVDEILSVERNLNEVRSEIESMEGRLKYLSNQVGYSTLNLNFYQTISTDYGFGGRFADGLISGWTNLLAFFIGLANVWPFLILLTGGVWLFVRWRRNRKSSTPSA